VLKVDEVRALITRRPYLDPLPGSIIPPRSRKPGAESEASASKRLSDYLALRRLPATHVANEHINKRVSGELIRQGMVLGWPDWYIARPVLYDGSWRVVHIELKSISDWKVSRDQADCIDRLWRDGQIAEIAWGFDWARALVDALFFLSSRTRVHIDSP
jgi:hypothetical protein